jgi:hypothetical protein
MPGSSSPASFPGPRPSSPLGVSGGQVSGRHRQKMLRWGWVDQAACRNNEVSRSMRSSRETAPSTSA